MTKSRKMLIIVLVSILAFLLIAATVLGAYAISLYNKVTYDPDANFASTADINDAFLRAYDKLNDGISIDEVIKDPELTPEQIEILKKYAENLEIDPNYTGSISPDVSLKPPVIDSPVSSDGIMNILFLGTDDRAGVSGSRSDTMIVVSINTKTKEITFTSLMRDIYIELVGLGRNGKLNSAYQFGGVKMLNDTIKTYFGIETDNYVRVNFDSFEKIINELGGVDVPFNDNEKIRKAEIKNLQKKSDFSTTQLVAGTDYTYHLTGAQALLYCRDRYSGQSVGGLEDGDFGRTSRQRKVLSSLVTKAKSMSFDQLMGALPEILEEVTTDLTIGDCTKLLTSVATTYSQYTVKNFNIPASKTWNYDTKKVGSVIVVDFEENSKLWRKEVYGE